MTRSPRATRMAASMAVEPVVGGAINVRGESFFRLMETPPNVWGESASTLSPTPAGTGPNELDSLVGVLVAEVEVAVSIFASRP